MTSKFALRPVPGMTDVAADVASLSADDAIGIGYGQPAQQHGIGEAEDGRIGPDAEGKSENRRHREPGTLP